MLILAHRGASKDAAENTLSAFEEAARQRADGVELDVMVCGSGEVVVCHDERLSRLSDVDWEVARTPWWKLRQADVGSKLGFGSERIPLLTEALAILPEHFVINLELKCDAFEDLGLAAKVAGLVRARALGGRVVLSSFNPLNLFRLAAVAPELKRGFLIDPDKPWAPQAGLLAPLTSTHSIHPHESQCTEARVSRWRARGWSVATWTVDDPERARALARAGVSYCITNTPSLLRKALAQ